MSRSSGRLAIPDATQKIVNELMRKIEGKVAGATTEGAVPGPAPDPVELSSKVSAISVTG